MVVDRFLQRHHALCGHLPTVLFSDGASVNTSAEMDAVLAKRMVTRKSTVPHNSEQNPAEVYSRLLTTIARTNMQASGRPLFLRGEALVCASYIHNRMCPPVATQALSAPTRWSLASSPIWATCDHGALRATQRFPTTPARMSMEKASMPLLK